MANILLIETSAEICSVAVECDGNIIDLQMSDNAMQHATHLPLYVESAMKLLKENGIKVGLAISPDTSIEEIKEYLPYIHMVLVMTVVPGKGGQSLIPETLEKVKALSKYLQENDYDLDIEVDGGINEQTAILAKEAGANILVAGNYIISSNDFAENVKKIK